MKTTDKELVTKHVQGLLPILKDAEDSSGKPLGSIDSITREALKLSPKQNYLNALAVMLTGPNDVCAATCYLDNKLLVATNAYEPEYPKKIIAALKKYANDLTDKSYQDLEEFAIKQAQLKLKDTLANIQSSVGQECGSGITEIQSKKSESELLKFLQDKTIKQLMDEDKSMNHALQVDKILEPVIRTRQFCNAMALGDIDKKLIQLINNDNVVYLEGLEHAEMKVLDRLMIESKNKTSKISTYIGIAKRPCAPCSVCLDTSKDELKANNITLENLDHDSHGYIYPGWIAPGCVNYKKFIKELDESKVGQYIKLEENYPLTGMPRLFDFTNLSKIRGQRDEEKNRVIKNYKEKFNKLTDSTHIYGDDIKSLVKEAKYDQALKAIESQVKSLPTLSNAAASKERSISELKSSMIKDNNSLQLLQRERDNLVSKQNEWYTWASLDKKQKSGKQPPPKPDSTNSQRLKQLSTNIEELISLLKIKQKSFGILNTESVALKEQLNVFDKLNKSTQIINELKSLAKNIESVEKGWVTDTLKAQKSQGNADISAIREKKEPKRGDSPKKVSTGEMDSKPKTQKTREGGDWYNGQEIREKIQLLTGGKARFPNVEGGLTKDPTQATDINNPEILSYILKSLNNINEDNIIIPLNVSAVTKNLDMSNTNHWVGLKVDASKNPKQVTYIDPMGHPMSQELYSQLTNNGFREENIHQPYKTSNNITIEDRDLTLFSPGLQAVKFKKEGSVWITDERNNPNDCGPFLTGLMAELVSNKKVILPTRNWSSEKFKRSDGKNYFDESREVGKYFRIVLDSENPKLDELFKTSDQSMIGSIEMKAAADHNRKDFDPDHGSGTTGVGSGTRGQQNKPHIKEASDQVVNQGTQQIDEKKSVEMDDNDVKNQLSTLSQTQHQGSVGFSQEANNRMEEGIKQFAVKATSQSSQNVSTRISQAIKGIPTKDLRVLNNAGKPGVMRNSSTSEDKNTSRKPSPRQINH